MLFHQKWINFWTNLPMMKSGKVFLYLQTANFIKMAKSFWTTMYMLIHWDKDFDLRCGDFVSLPCIKQG